MSAGFSDVLRDAIVEVGVCMDRILDRVDRKRRRMRCGTRMGIEGHDSGIFEIEKKRWVESSPPREKYCTGMSLEGETQREVVGAARERPTAWPHALQRSHKLLLGGWRSAEGSEAVVV